MQRIQAKGMVLTYKVPGIGIRIGSIDVLNFVLKHKNKYKT